MAPCGFDENWTAGVWQPRNPAAFNAGAVAEFVRIRMFGTRHPISHEIGYAGKAQTADGELLSASGGISKVAAGQLASRWVD